MNVGDTMCTSGDVQYIREIPLVHWGMFSTSEGYHDAFGGEQLDKSFQFLLKTPMYS